MSWRAELEDKYTVKCRKCKKDFILPTKKPNQKYGVCQICSSLKIFTFEEKLKEYRYSKVEAHNIEKAMEQWLKGNKIYTKEWAKTPPVWNKIYNEDGHLVKENPECK